MFPRRALALLNRFTRLFLNVCIIVDPLAPDV
jgi:hypothetical protein